MIVAWANPFKDFHDVPVLHHYISKHIFLANDIPMVFFSLNFQYLVNFPGDKSRLNCLLTKR